MFKMSFKTQVKPEYQPPAPQIKMKPLENRYFGSIFSPMISVVPCSSCGHSK